MSFTLNGTTLTQSGTDADLSGLSGISGVTVTSFGTGANTLKEYSIGNYKLVITGALTIANDILHASGSATRAIEVQNGGSLTLGAQVTLNRHTGPDPQIALSKAKIIITKDSGIPYQSEFYGFVVQNGGSFTQYGGTLESTMSVEAQAGANVTLRDARWFMWSDSISYVNVYLRSDKVDIDGWTLESNGTCLPCILGNFTQFNNYKPINCIHGVTSGGLDNNIRVLRNYLSGFARGDLSHAATAAQAGYDIYGARIGNDMLAWGAGSNSSNGRSRLFISYAPRFVLADGTPITNVTLYGKDSNNGNRSPVYEPATRVYTPNSYTAGALDAFDVLTCVWHNGGDSNKLEFIKDIRLPVDLGFAHYNYSFLDSTITDSKTYLQQPQFIMAIDPLISETSKATVDAYLSIDNAAQFYDRAKAHVLNNYTGQRRPLVTRQGDVIDAGSYNITLDPNASAAFTFDGSMITLKTSTFTGSLKTTGTITIGNGAQVSGAIEDSAGVRLAIRLTSGDAFNILATRLDTGAELGFRSGVTSATYNLPRGVKVRYAVWAEGFETEYGLYDTANGGAVLTLSPPSLAEVVNTSLDVGTLLNSIDLALANGEYSIVFQAPMVVSLEQIKAIMHRLLGRETSLRAGIGALIAGKALAVGLSADEIQINTPSVFLRRGSNLTATDRVELNGYFNVDSAKAISSTYILNPSDGSGRYVNYLSVKPAIDAGRLAWAVQGLVALQLEPGITAIKAKTDNLPSDPARENTTAEARDHARAANMQTQQV